MKLAVIFPYLDYQQYFIVCVNISMIENVKNATESQCFRNHLKPPSKPNDAATRSVSFSVSCSFDVTLFSQLSWGRFDSKW